MKYKNATNCRGCEEKEIDVWHITLPDGKNGYYDTDVDHTIDMLRECSPGEGYTIKKERMRADVYYSLPEFTGF